MLDTAQIRAQFPALQDSSTVYFDNAGGSQLPRCVIDAVHDHLTRNYAQLGGDYAPSARAMATVRRAHDVVKAFLNVGDRGEVLLGPSTTALCHTVAQAYGDRMDEARAGADSGWGKAISRDEVLRRNRIIVATSGHEANIGPWMRLAHRGFEVVPWRTRPGGDGLVSDAQAREAQGSWRPSLAELRAMLNDRTLLVAMPQVSNILGEVWDAGAVTREAHRVGALAAIDGVAFAPHHAPDVRAIGCDWYVHSTYKVYGPHMGAMFGKRERFAELTGPNHFFIPREELPRKFEPGGPSHEGCAAICALWDFARTIAGEAASVAPGELNRDVFVRAMEALEARERAVGARVLTFLRDRPDVRIIGPAHPHGRVATIAFAHDRLSSEVIAKTANARGLGIRFGHFYSKRLLDELIEAGALGWVRDPAEGVVRVSLLGYTSDDEVERLIAHLLEHFGSSGR